MIRSNFWKLALSLACLFNLTSCVLDAQIGLLNTLDNASSAYYRGTTVLDLAGKPSVIPGTVGADYAVPSIDTLTALKERNLSVLRLSILWERMQPTLGGPLDSNYLQHVIDVLKNCHGVGLQAILELRNFGRYSGHDFNSPDGPSKIQFADLWSRLTLALMDSPTAFQALYAVDIMHEPTSFTTTISSPLTFEGFEAGLAGWATGGTSSLSHEPRSSGHAAKLHVPASAGSGIVKGFSLDGGIRRAVISDGPTLTATVYVPETTPGTAIYTRFRIIDSAYKYKYSSRRYIPKEQAVQITFTPAETVWPSYRSLGIEFIIDGSDGSADFEFFVDEVKQGTTAETSPEKIWEEFAQAAVDAIRSHNSSLNIIVSGYGHSSAASWSTNHPTKWINDPSDRIIYQASLYADAAQNGSYNASFSSETSQALSSGFDSVADRYVSRAKNFTDWVQNQNAKGFFANIAWPNAETVGDAEAESWNAVGAALFEHLDSIHMGATVCCASSIDSPSISRIKVYDLQPLTPLSPASTLEMYPGY